jgi:hypothetical protein
LKTFRHFVTFAAKASIYMRLEKEQFKKPKEHTVKIDSKTNDKLRHLAYINKLTRKEITKQAIDLYQKVNIFS